MNFLVEGRPIYSPADVSKGGGKYSHSVTNILKTILEDNAQTEFIRTRSTSSLVKPESKGSVEDALYESKAFCKIWTSQIAMHLPTDWREKFFWQLDNLMDIDNWEDDDLPITKESFKTLMRMLTLKTVKRRPGLGVSNVGNAVATWTHKDRRLTIECFAGDLVRWVLSVPSVAGPESAAGKVHLSRLCTVLAPYEPEIWFENRE